MVKASGKDVDDLKSNIKKLVKKEVFKYKSRNTEAFDDDKSDCKEEIEKQKKAQEENPDKEEVGNKTSEAYLLKQKQILEKMIHRT